MRLSDYLDREGHGATARIAKAAGTRWQTVNEIARKGHVPKAELAKKIEAATDGAVSAAELLGLGTIPTITTNSDASSGDLANRGAA